MDKIYLDNNATTFMSKDTINVINKYMNLGNPSSVYPSALQAKKVIEDASNYIKKVINANSNSEVIFTSGASESNAMVLRMVAKASKFKPPIILSSKIEHSSILETLNIMQEQGDCVVSLASPNINGCVDVDAIKPLITTNTCLVSIMSANNEIGSMNNIYSIGRLCRQFNIPFHSDMTQSFGKFSIDVQRVPVDFITTSFHKSYGPIGCGMVWIREGIKLKAMIGGHQFNEMRGGTENVPYIAGSIYSLNHTLTDRTTKNMIMLKKKQMILDGIKGIPYPEFVNRVKRSNIINGFYDIPNCIIIFTPLCTMKSLPNTIYLSVFKQIKSTDTEFIRNNKFCNLAFKRLLIDNGVIISTGSACLKDGGSYVADTLLKYLPDGFPTKFIQCGILRISIGDNTSETDISKFINIFNNLLFQSI